MEKFAPNHIAEYCYLDSKDVLYCHLKNKYQGDNSFVYKLKCTCNCESFMVYKDVHPSVFAKCCYCDKMITVYDLDYYPVAVKLKREFPLKNVNDIPTSVYVNYEYNDEFLYEDDVEFDENDISWCKVFVENNNTLVKILDDETA